MRLFVAIVPPPAVVAELSRVAEPAAGRLRAGAALDGPDPGTSRWPSSVRCPSRCCPVCGARLERAAGRHPALDLPLRGGGAFPSAARARAVMAVVTAVRRGRTGPARAAPLHALAASVAAGARRAGAAAAGRGPPVPAAPDPRPAPAAR